ncbi:MAG: tRNA glutamyl-Q(34) synthetase GluQRS [Cyanobium sp.]
MAALPFCHPAPSDPAGFTPAALPGQLADLLEAGAGLRLQGYRGRFAPSPSGALHLGNLRTALLSWLDARLQGGVWLLRIDDLDTPRNRQGAGEAIEADLRWLGLTWDESVVWQSQRRGRYATVLSALRRGGLLYPCRCSRRMLADISAPHARRGVYPGTCRTLRGGWGAQGERLPSWRLRLRDGPITWEERFAQPGLLDGASAVGDPVLRRADGFLAYHLATAVDELALGISDVVRGEDLWAATAPQVEVIRALGQPPPRYGHVPLWRDGQGQRLSKREASEGLAGLRARGLDAAGVVGDLAASLALVPPGSRLSAHELLASLNLDQFTQALRQRAEAQALATTAPAMPATRPASPARDGLRI